jgi:hypothetical protein
MEVHIMNEVKDRATSIIDAMVEEDTTMRNTLYTKWVQFTKFVIDNDLGNTEEFNQILPLFQSWDIAWPNSAYDPERFTTLSNDLTTKIDELMAKWAGTLPLLNDTDKVPVSATIGGTIGKGVGKGAGIVAACVAKGAVYTKDVIAPSIATGAKVTGKGIWANVKAGISAAKSEYKARK